jgi:hypothetical protein
VTTHTTLASTRVDASGWSGWCQRGGRRERAGTPIERRQRVNCKASQTSSSVWQLPMHRLTMAPTACTGRSVSESVHSECALRCLAGTRCDTPSGGVVGARVHDECAQKHATSNNLEQCGAWRRWVRERTLHIRVCQWLNARGEEQNLPTTTARGRVVTSAE